MKIDSAVIAKLLTLTAVTGLVSTRIRGDDLDEDDQLPAIVVEVLREEVVGGDLTLTAENTLWEAEVAVHCYAHKRTLSREIEDKVRTNNTDPGTGLHGFSGATAQGTIAIAAHVEIESAVIDPQSGEGSPRYVTSGIYLCQYEKTAHGYTA